MTFSPADLVLLTALVATSTCVLLLHRKLDALRHSQSEYRTALADSTRALDRAREAVSDLSRDGQNLVLSLCLKIHEAETVLRQMDREENRADSNVIPLRAESGANRPRI
jgi:hypothetical protein